MKERRDDPDFDAFMRAMYRQLDEEDLPGDEPYDVEAGLERFRGWLRDNEAGDGHDG